MASVSGPPHVASALELNLLPARPAGRSPLSWALIGLVSTTCQVFIFLSLIQIATWPDSETAAPREVIVHTTPLYLPPELLTQREHNRKRPSSDIALADLLARQAAAARPAAARHFEPPKVQAPKGPQTPQIQPPPDLAVNNGPTQLPPGTVAGLIQPIAPQPSDGRPLGSEAPQKPAPIMRAPHASVESAIQSLAQNPANRRMTVTESDPSRPLPGAPGSNGQAGTQHVDVELKSDPNAPDFRKYLAQILAIVRANWRRVTPESVHLGTLRGENTIELIINRDGSIPKLVIGDSANIDALDRASVAGVSMSNPLPPLPDDFKGQQVQVTFTFKYNILE